MFAGILLFFLAGYVTAAPPRVIKTVPQNGDRSVDPGLRKIRIEFDQDMSQQGYSMCGGGPDYPKTIGKPRWINRRTIVMGVKLQPNHEYKLSVNCPSYKNFKNLQGQPAVVYPVEFKTGSVKEKVVKSPRLLLRRGLYAEETEGNLDKAIEIYEQIIDEASHYRQVAAKATYQLGMCYLKKGEKNQAAEYFQQVISTYSLQKTLAKRAQEQLEKIGVSASAKGNLFEILGGNVCSYLGNKYGEVCAEAGMKKLYSNSHIYFVDSDFVLRMGGMGYVYNWTGKPITENYRISGTKKTNLKYYDVPGNEMDIEIIPDEQRKGFYHIYWNPKEPLGPGECFNYGWATDGSKKLSGIRNSSVYPLTMQNHFGDHCYETFFLVVPEGTTIVNRSEEYTKMKNFQEWDIYWWEKEVPENTNNVVNVSLQKVPQYTQQMHNEIEPNGLIHFKNPHNFTNICTTPMTSTTFINSDFVNVTAMYYKNGQPVKYTTTHEGNHFRYNITFDKPVLPGETIEGTVEGTITGLIKPVASMPDTYQYYMNHSPSTNVPTLRVETYLLPKGAEVISTSPGMKKSEKNSRIELAVKKIIPAGGSLLTTFQYRLTGAKLASSEPLKLESAPWVDGEMLRFNLNTMTGMKIGEIIYTAQTARSEKESIWRIESYMNITVNKTQQYTTVDAALDDFAPVFGRTKNQLGDFTAEYKPDKVKLTVTAGEKETTREIKLDSAVYDNEQVLYLIRRMPLQEDYTARFQIFPVQSGAVSECKIAVTGKEKLTVSAGTFDCYAVELTVYVGQVKALEHHLWISTDRHQYLVKYDSGQAIVELAEIGLKTATAKNIELSEYGISLRLPGGWFHTENPTMGVYRFSVQLISPQIKSWLVLTGGERVSAFDSARTAADMDIQVLKGFFKNYTVRQDSWTDLTVDSMPAVSFQADYEDKAAQMVEYRTYILGKSMIYWFVLRIDKDKFEEGKPEFDAIVNSFRLNRNALRAKKLDADDLNGKGWQLWNQRKFAEAEKLFQQAVTKDPTLANAWNGLGWSQLNQGKKLNAKASFEKCVELEPTHAAALNGLGWFAKGQGKTEEAISHWEKAVEATPNATAALNGLTTTYMELNQYDKAVKYYKMWLKAEPDNADARAGLKKARAKLKRR